MSRYEHSVKAPWFPLLAFGVFATCVFAAGFAYYQSQVRDIQIKNIEVLSAIADLKIMQIIQWRQQHIQDVLLLANDTDLVKNVREALTAPGSIDLNNEILSVLRMARRVHSLLNIIICDADGNQLFAALAGSWPGPDPRTAALAQKTGRPVWGDLVRDPASGKIYLDIVAPLPSVQTGEAAVAAVLVVRIDPNESLFPLIKSWPTASQSAETLLVRREGQEIVYLHELRNLKTAALVLRRPVSEKNLPAARAVRGEMNSHKGIDYRETAVLYTAKKVPDTPWLMVAKIDEAEILSPLHRLVLIAGCIYWLIMTAVGVLLYRHLDLRKNVEVRREQDLEAATRDLNLRVRELNCLYTISSLVEHCGDSMSDVLTGVVDLLPSAWQYPEVTCARISIYGRQYATKACRESAWGQSADIVIKAKTIGAVEVFFLEERASFVKGTAMPLQKNFINEVAERISRVVERTQIQKDLQENFSRLNTIMESSPVGIYLTDEKGDCIFANRKWCDMAGITQGEARGVAWLAGIHPDDRDAVRANWNTAVESHGSWGHEYRFMNKSGTVTWVFGTATAIYDEKGGTLGYVGINTDITARRRTEAFIKRLNEDLEQKVIERTAQLQQAIETLRESEERYRTVADFTFDWEFWLSPEQKYLYVSPSFERITGYQAQRLLDDPGFLEKIVHPDDVPLIIPHMNSTEQTRGIPIDFRIITRAGEERWISHECQQVYTPDGRHLGNRGSNSDITEIKRLRDEAVREAHLASIGRLAAGVAHEINNPISGVINYAQIIRTKCTLNEKYTGYLDELIAEAERVATIVKDLLIFARPHPGAPGRADLQDIYGQTFSLLAKQLDKSSVKVRSMFPDDLPQVLARPQQLKQVILNFFTNALYALNKKFPGPDPEKIIEVTAESEGPLVRLTFHDHGIGIPADMLARVCDPFFSTKPPGEGTGLGLSISHTIIKDHGGRLRIASREGDYTKVTIELPAMEERL
jgi:PAS domain S-box-containing protein